MNPSKREIEFPNMISNVIIATKGLSCTAKSTISKTISVWAKCHLVSMDDLLDALSIENGYSAKSLPSKEEADRLHRLACNALLKVAHRKLKVLPFRLVVKTRLCSFFELDMLLRLAVSFPSPSLVIIVECKMKNEHRYRSRLEHCVERFGHEEWYKARTWKDIENARDEIGDRAWDDYARSLIDKHRDDKGKSPLVIKLVVDPYDDLNIDTYNFETTSSTLLDAINYLMLSGDQAAKDEELLLGREDTDLIEDKELPDEEIDLELVKSSYAVVQYDKLQRYLFKMDLKASKYKEWSKYICATQGGDCVFKFLVLEDHRHGFLNNEMIYCGVCEDLVHKVQHVYTCYFCVLIMHESCAKSLNMEFLQRIPYSPFDRPWFDYPKELKENDIYKLCVDSRKGFSKETESCLFNTHLKCNMLPTIIKHEGHKHLLSIRLLEKTITCKACGAFHRATSDYVCHICKFYFQVECIFLPSQVMHEHGGYEHPMKLTYSHKNGMEQEESYWCDFCYREIDPQSWFYFCQECSYYVTHPYCFGKETILKARRYDNLPIQL